MSLKIYAKNAARVASLVALAALSGCGVDDIQLNGKIFDAMGVNNTSSVKKEVTVRERSPLVVPPGLEKLPEPGSQAALQADAIAEIKDYDASRQKSQADLERQQAEYCKVHYEQAKVTAIKKWNAPEEEEAQ